MSDDGYIYIRNWDRFQRYKDRRPPWIKLAGALLDDDRYLELTLADRGLLQDLWKLASMSGDGRVSAHRKSLAHRLNVRRVSLEPLIQAGWIEVRAQRAHTQRTRHARPETETETDIPLTPASGGNGFHPDQPRRLTRKQRQKLERDQKRKGAVQRCRFLWHDGLQQGEHPDSLRTSLEYEYHHDKTIVTEAIGKDAP